MISEKVFKDSLSHFVLLMGALYRKRKHPILSSATLQSLAFFPLQVASLKQ